MNRRAFFTAGTAAMAAMLTGCDTDPNPLPFPLVEGEVTAKVDRSVEQVWVLVLAHRDGEEGHAQVTREVFDATDVGDWVVLRCEPGQICERVQ